MIRDRYSADVLAQASLDVANNPELGNPDLARRTEEEIGQGGDAFYFVFRALKTGRPIMQRAEEIRVAEFNGENRSLDGDGAGSYR